MKKLLFSFLFLIPFLGYSQTDLCDGFGEICVIQFNAGFNEVNKVQWLPELSDCTTSFVDILTDPSIPQTYKIVVVPTILIIDEGEEVGRFQANIMMQMESTKEDVQNSIEEIIMSKF